ncbi:claudin-34-like [Plectropomus leopardus]|uniref:claudin-34-like n=1 Tax=Plectropomus leopardus TaxID=160734 RepID=UPI001C4A9023|nr:claudin-34-like [Plectropomus leopardus]
MTFLAHTAHWQFLGLVSGFLAWILIMTTVGLNEWRLWHVADVSVITSGVAWVGIWRACFYSHALPSMENCQSISVSAPFAPAEIPAAQVLMVLAMICGLVGNITAVVAMRMVYFSLEDRRNVRLVFVLAGMLYVLTATLCVVPLAWNLNSVLNNRTIDFPPEFQLPAAPLRQQVGSAIGVGLAATILMLVSGLIFLSYRYVWETLSAEAPRASRVPLHGPWTETTPAQRSELPNGDNQGRDNPAFHYGEVS